MTAVEEMDQFWKDFFEDARKHVESLPEYKAALASGNTIEARRLICLFLAGDGYTKKRRLNEFKPN